MRCVCITPLYCSAHCYIAQQVCTLIGRPLSTLISHQTEPLIDRLANKGPYWRMLAGRQARPCICTSVRTPVLQPLLVTKAATQQHTHHPAGLLDWHDVTEPLIWRGSEADCLDPASPTAQLPPAWQLMLLSDGSVTRHLQHLSRTPVNVECLQMQQLDADNSSHVPAACAAIRGPLLQRQDDDTPIWVSLSRGQLELYREIQEVQLGHNAELESLLGCPGPFWSRKYFFWNKGRPLTLIHEVFSPSLEGLLGPLPAA